MGGCQLPLLESLLLVTRTEYYISYIAMLRAMDRRPMAGLGSVMSRYSGVKAPDGQGDPLWRLRSTTRQLASERDYAMGEES
jgi:hypothetical protein